MAQLGWCEPDFSEFTTVCHSVCNITSSLIAVSFQMTCCSFQIRMHRKFAVEEGDHLTMLNVYEAFIKVSTATTQRDPAHTCSPGVIWKGGYQKLVDKGMARDSFIFLLDVLPVD